MLTKHAVSSALLPPVSTNAFDTVSLRTCGRDKHAVFYKCAWGMLPLVSNTLHSYSPSRRKLGKCAHTWAWVLGAKIWTNPSSSLTDLCWPQKKLLECIDFTLCSTVLTSSWSIWKQKLAAAVERNGSPVDEQMHKDLTTIVWQHSLHTLSLCTLRIIPAIVLGAAEASQFLQGRSLHAWGGILSW